MRRLVTRTLGRVLGLVALATLLDVTAGEARTCRADIKKRRAAASAPRFGFVFEGSEDAIQVYLIKVKLAGKVVCQVATPRVKGFQPYVGDWTYGDVPPGFVVETTCSPLVAEKRYQIEVMGSCLGTAWFTAGSQ
jgi:hypothetical protein